MTTRISFSCTLDKLSIAPKDSTASVSSSIPFRSWISGDASVFVPSVTNYLRLFSYNCRVVCHPYCIHRYPHVCHSSQWHRPRTEIHPSQLVDGYHLVVADILLQRYVYFIVRMFFSLSFRFVFVDAIFIAVWDIFGGYPNYVQSK